jgi:hypothetical protein
MGPPAITKDGIVPHFFLKPGTRHQLLELDLMFVEGVPLVWKVFTFGWSSEWVMAQLLK